MLCSLLPARFHPRFQHSFFETHENLSLCCQIQFALLLFHVKQWRREFVVVHVRLLPRLPVTNPVPTSAIMFGRTAAQLVRELTNDDNHIRRFNHDLFDKIVGEIQEHFHQVTTIMAKMQEENPDGQMTPTDENYNGALIHHQSILRNKRCLLAYTYNRAHRLQRLRWQLGAILPEDIKGRLHPSEKEFVKGYSEVMSSCMTKLDLDLTVDASPPKDPYIQVRVLDDIGEVLLGDQSTSLLRNSIHFVKRTEAESLISQGLVEEFTG